MLRRGTSLPGTRIPGTWEDSRPMTYVYDFDDRSGGGRELLGGKGAGLAEMTQIGVPVPAGFTITTDACRAYMQNGKQFPDGLEPEIEERRVGKECRSRWSPYH